jgi:hypothetical protein
MYCEKKVLKTKIKLNLTGELFEKQSSLVQYHPASFGAVHFEGSYMQISPAK